MEGGELMEGGGLAPAGYRGLWSKIRSAFTEAFVGTAGHIESGTQTAYALGLHMGLVPDELRAAAAGHLVTAVKAADWHLTTGFVGVGYLLPVLSSTGHGRVAYRLLAQESPPSWRYMLDSGATTIWERWDGWTSARGFQSAWMNSFNHYALGSVGEWLYRSVRGTISAGWERSGGLFSYRVEVPPNVTATVCVPSDDAAAVRAADGTPPAGTGAFPGAAGTGEAVFHVGPGTHTFTGQLTGDVRDA